MSIEKLETNPEEFKVNKVGLSRRNKFALSKKNRLIGGGTCDCSIVAIESVSKIVYYFSDFSDPGTPIFNVTASSINVAVLTSVQDVSRYCEKIWINIRYTDYNGLDQWGLLELNLDESIPSATFSRIIPFQNQGLVPILPFLPSQLSQMGGGAGIDYNTVVLINEFLGPPEQNRIIRFDISGNTAVETLIINSAFDNHISNNPAFMDVAYLPGDNTYVVAEYPHHTTATTNPANGFIRHYNSSGTLLGSIELSGITAGVFGYDGNVYASLLGGPLEILDLTNYVVSGTATATGTLTYTAYQDGATNPGCTDNTPCAPCDQSSFCYNIGDTGPGGGTIFSVPLGHPQNNGVNQTNFYYEVAKNDINVGGAIPSSIYNQSCGDPIKQVVTVDASWFSQNVPNAGNTQDITFDFGPGTANPSFDPQNLNIGDTVQALDAQGNNMFPPNTTVTVTNKTFFPSAPNIVLVEFDTPLNVLPNGVQLLSTQIATIKFAITIVAAGLSAAGNEFGAHDKTIQTSIDFGTGQDNTDTIHSYPITPGIHPTLSSRQIAATECLNHSSTGTYLGQPFTASDWFLPSLGEFEEIQNQMTLGNIPGVGFKSFNTQTNEHVYWTSSAFRDNQFPGFTMPGPDRWAWVYKNMPSGLTPNIAFRCHPLSVRPIRRFECEPIKPPVDEGITYDYRIDTFGLPCAGNINQIALNSFISPNITTSVTIDAYAFSMLNQSTNQSGVVIFSNSDFVIAVDSTTVSSLPAIGSQFGLVGNVQYNLLGPVVDVIDIATHPQLGGLLPTFQAQAGANIDTFIVFNPSSNFLGPNGFFIGQNYPTLSFIDTLSYNLLSPNPAYSPPVFGSIFEIGHSNVMIQGMSRQDVRLNDVVGLGFNDRIETRVGEIFNIKIYSQYEELIGDWDYKLTNARNGFGCCTTHCFKSLYLELSQTNYVNPSFSSDPNIVDLKVYHEGNLVAGHPEGWAYVAITCVTDNTFNSNFVRGNTLNLENWRGTTQNNRTKNTSFPISGMQWKWQREVCGVNQNTSNCCGPGCGRYHAEVNPPQFNIYCNNFNNAVPNHTILFNNKQDCIGRAEAATNDSSAKLTSPSVEYGDEVNQCFEDGLEEVEVGIYKDLGENKSRRKKFVDRNKVGETGPFGINGYYPLYDTIEAARFNSPTFFATRDGEDTYGYHIHEFEGVEYYMPNGLKMGVTQFHGDYDGQIIPETIIQEQQVEQEIVEPVQELPSVVTITPIEPEQEEELPTPTPTYTPPPSTPSGGSGGGGY